MKKFIYLLAGSVLGFSHVAWAGLSISPVQLYLGEKSKQKSTTIVISSKDFTTSKTFEASAVRWAQNEQGEDIFEPDPNMIINPKNFIIAPDSKQIVRVGLNQAVVNNDHPEKTWRIIFQEVAPPAQDNTVNFLFNISVPLFVGRQTPIKLDIQPKLNTPGLNLSIKNDSLSHIQISKITLLDANKKEIETNYEMKYLLPQSRYHFNFKKNIPVVDFGKYKLLVQTDKQDQPLEFNLKE